MENKLLLDNLVKIKIAVKEIQSEIITPKGEVTLSEFSDNMEILRGYAKKEGDKKQVELFDFVISMTESHLNIKTRTYPKAKA
tara:strand:+ start:502 stop:750 length:249 start_codon:yes stop_codon:yes gene_type:complete